MLSQTLDIKSFRARIGHLDPPDRSACHDLAGNDPVVLLWESQGNSFQIQKNLMLSSVFIEWEKTPKEIGDLTDFVHITR